MAAGDRFSGTVIIFHAALEFCVTERPNRARVRTSGLVMADDQGGDKPGTMNHPFLSART